MHAVLMGACTTPSTSAVGYAYPTQVLQRGWQTSENTTGFGEATCALSDAIVITKLTFYVTTATGGASSWKFTVRKNAADTAASVTITGAATSASWSGSISFAQLDLITVSCTPTSGPPTAGNVYWTIEYDSVGSDYYVIMGAMTTNQNLDYYANPFSGGSPYSGTATDFEVVIPTDCTAVKIAGSQSENTGAGTYSYIVRKNNTTDSSFKADVTASIQKAVSAAGSLVFAPGDTMVIKRTGGTISNSNWVDGGFCVTIVPSVIGEVITAFGNLAASSTSGTEYETPRGIGLNAWNATEANAYTRFPACALKKFYVKLTTATGSAKTRTFTVRSNVADTAIVATLTNTATGNDITHAAQHGEGNFISVKMVPTSTPAADNGVKMGLVMVIPQQRKSLSINQTLQAALR